MINRFIHSAKDFKNLHKDVGWGFTANFDYIDSIYHFTIFKINQWRNTWKKVKSFGREMNLYWQ